jgi:hypothetical protein
LAERLRHAKQRSAQDLAFEAGDGIRTHAVQLGNSVLGAQTLVMKALTLRFSAKNEDYN